jgi:MFS family permease
MPLSPRRGLARKLQQAHAVYNQYPRQFWVLILGSFIDRLGGALLFPFFTLYITRKFGVGMTTVGVIFGVFALSSVVGSMLGGALTDRLGRKGVFLFGLVSSALSSLVMGSVNQVQLFMLVVVFVGLLADSAGPARQAMVADLLPDEQRAQGFAILRVVINLSVTIGPMIGGLLAARSYMLLFVCDAVTSLVAAGVVYVAIQETRPASAADASGQEESMAQTFGGYLLALRDTAFGWFLIGSLLMTLVYMQMNTTLAVYLRDSHGISEQGFGYILSLNAAMVVLFQFPITRWITPYRPLLMMAAGMVLYAAGFAMYGFVSAYALFLGAMAIITVGEMVTAPVGQAIVSRLAPEDMRGRYMAVYGFSWVLPSAVGPLLAGLVMDNADPRWVWYACGVIGLLAAAVFYAMQWYINRSTWSAIHARLDIMQQLEDGRISAEEAARLLEGVEEGKLASLGPAGPGQAARHVRIRVSDLASGAIKTDLRLPLGLVHTALQLERRLATALDAYDAQALRELISRSSGEAGVQTLDTDDHERLEVSME